MLDFRNLTFSSSSRRVRAIMPPHSKFRLNWTIWSQVIVLRFSTEISVSQTVRDRLVISGRSIRVGDLENWVRVSQGH